MLNQISAAAHKNYVAGQDSGAFAGSSGKTLHDTIQRWSGFQTPGQTAEGSQPSFLDRLNRAVNHRTDLSVRQSVKYPPSQRFLPIRRYSVQTLPCAPSADSRSAPPSATGTACRLRSIASLPPKKSISLQAVPCTVRAYMALDWTLSYFLTFDRHFFALFAFLLFSPFSRLPPASDGKGRRPPQSSGRGLPSGRVSAGRSACSPSGAPMRYTVSPFSSFSAATSRPLFTLTQYLRAYPAGSSAVST